MTSDSDTPNRLVRYPSAGAPYPTGVSPAVAAAEPGVLHLTMGDVEADEQPARTLRDHAPRDADTFGARQSDWSRPVDSDAGAVGHDGEDSTVGKAPAGYSWYRRQRATWHDIAEEAARTHRAFGPGIGVPVLLGCTLALGIIATFVVVGYELTGPALLLLPTVGSMIGYTVVMLHAVFTLGQAPLMIFAGIRRDRYFPEIGLSLSAVSGLALIVLLASEHIAAQTPSGMRIYLALLVVQVLFAPYLIWSRRINLTYKHRLRNHLAAPAPVEPVLEPGPESPMLPAPASQNDVMSYVKHCPRCSELIRRAATDCRHCGFQYTPELLEKERRMFAGG